MIQALKEYTVIMLIAAIVYWLCGPALATKELKEKLPRRMLTWAIISSAGLLTPSIFIYMAIALPILMWHSTKEDNPAALYALLFLAVPHTSVQLPTFIVNQLFEINHGRFLSLALLLPALVRMPKSADPNKPKVHAAQWGMYLFFSLILIFLYPYFSSTHLLRITVIQSLDWMIPFLACMLLASTMEKLRDCMAMWVLSGAIVGAVGIFESARGWLLYVSIGERWGSENAFAFLLREGTLRAQASAGHSLALGYWLSIAWGFYIHLYHRMPSRRSAVMTGALILGGLIATWSRGPWLTATVITIIYLALDPRGASSATKSLGILVALFAAAFISPYWNDIKRYIPFVGSVDSENIEYRQRLFETAIEYIKINPLTGNPLVLQYLESLRQGQGIIDLMNGYLQIAMFYGIIALTGFLVMLLGPVASSWKIWKSSRFNDHELAWTASVFIAVLLGTVLFIATASYGGLTFYLAGMALAFLRAAAAERKTQSTAAIPSKKHPAQFHIATQNIPAAAARTE
jgi:hypothetical protein